ncbi:MAG: hypothetical protein ACOCQA_04015 [bacterium]
MGKTLHQFMKMRKTNDELVLKHCKKLLLEDGMKEFVKNADFDFGKDNIMIKVSYREKELIDSEYPKHLRNNYNFLIVRISLMEVEENA